MRLRSAVIVPPSAPWRKRVHSSDISLPPTQAQINGTKMTTRAEAIMVTAINDQLGQVSARETGKTNGTRTAVRQDQDPVKAPLVAVHTILTLVIPINDGKVLYAGLQTHWEEIKLGRGEPLVKVWGSGTDYINPVLVACSASTAA